MMQTRANRQFSRPREGSRRNSRLRWLASKNERRKIDAPTIISPTTCFVCSFWFCAAGCCIHARCKTKIFIFITQTKLIFVARSRLSSFFVYRHQRCSYMRNYDKLGIEKCRKMCQSPFVQLTQRRVDKPLDHVFGNIFMNAAKFVQRSWSALQSN